jgi:SAM-dependent methyltransferase
MALKKILIQGSSTSWGGAVDDSVRLIQGVPTIRLTYEALMRYFPNIPIEIIAPEFDKNSGLENFFCDLKKAVTINYGFNESPLKRMVFAAKTIPDNDHILRINAANLFIGEEALDALQKVLEKLSHIDCIKFPDDYPAQLVADIYRVGALRELVEELDIHSPFQAHPKYIFQNSIKYTCTSILVDNLYRDTKLSSCRNQLKNLNDDDFLDVDLEKSISLGDQLLFHYKLANDYINNDLSIILDIACGAGYGASFLAGMKHHVVGGDINPKTIEYANSRYSHQENLTFKVMDALQVDYPNSTFDYITSFETIEHISDVDKYLIELKRLLKPNGLIFVSTPQNSLGHIPLTFHHEYEYGRHDLRGAIEKHFSIVNFFGIKQGCIFFKDDEVGNNSFVIGKKLT